MTLDSLRRQLEAAEKTRVQNACTAMTAELKRTAPVVTEKLRNATSVTPQSYGVQIKAIAQIDTDYAGFVTEGTRPHPIYARNNVLAFKWPKRGPGTFFFRHVNHPGTSENLFFRRVVDKWGEYLRAS